MGGPLSQVSIGTQAISSGNLAAFGSAFFTSRVSADTGSTILGGARRGGAVVLATDSTDNDENQAVFTGGKCIGAFAAGQTGRFVARIKGTEGNTNDQDWYIGFADVADTADFFTDSDAFAAAVDGIGLYKLKDSMFFRTAALNASTNSAVGLTTTAYATGTDYDIEIQWECVTAGMTIRYYVNGTLLETVTGFSYTSLNAMYPCIILKNGGGTAESFEVSKFMFSNS